MFRNLWLIFILLLPACTNLLFVPTKYYPVTPDVADLIYEDLYIETDDAIKLHGWKIHAGKAKAGSILFFHGNGDNISTQLPNTFWLAKEGYDLYIFDYRGYGQSEGEVDLDDTIDDMGLMIASTVEQLPEDEKLIVMGHSLGASMSTYSVAHSTHRDRIKALITIEAFSDYHDVTQEVLSKSWLFWLFQWPLSFTIDNSYRPLDSIGLISPIPVLILHSGSDEMIDVHHAERLYEAANEPKSLQLIDSNHNNIFNKTENRKVLLDYINTLSE